ncbi:MAG: molecular chaperone TorD family protein [Methylibium sp.]|uniref:TorD/DmsD family molecular chaperone n=1 Tax=Methylibium sp. TaxID=2067992 RepID=UPI0018043EA0|nr:molecular chaperone TorD family protein [Methylibium sp.]MBA2722834.1 molecular chaperone TorD family protein [Methylibium sp.]MBA3588793.1 molecular chaperone TorD family protein [Methylibium sp.]
MKPQPLQFSTPDDREELARAEVYGLLAQLFIAAPAADFYEQLRVAPTEAPTPGAFLESSWGTLVASARRLPLETVATEYDALFQGIGKPEVFLYGSFHLAGAINDKPLVQLRHDLRALGLERIDSAGETEDHIASLCEVMRFLIAGDDPVLGSLAAQKRFHSDHLAGWTERLCEQIAGHGRADFYRDAALFARDFFAVERQAFDLLE